MVPLHFSLCRTPSLVTPVTSSPFIRGADFLLSMIDGSREKVVYVDGNHRRGCNLLDWLRAGHLGGGVWSRNGTDAYRLGHGIKAGRVWTNCCHLYPADAAFGGYKESASDARRMILAIKNS